MMSPGWIFENRGAAATLLELSEQRRNRAKNPPSPTNPQDSNETSGEQLGAASGEFHISPGFVPHHPTFVDRPLDTVAELLCRAAGL